jgi:hypothetical protein
MKAILFILIIGCWVSCLAASPEPGLLFYLSGDQEFTADYAAGGDPQPNFIRGVKMISDGARGRGFECANLLGARQHLRRARHAQFVLALALPGWPNCVSNLSRRLL